MEHTPSWEPNSHSDDHSEHAIKRSLTCSEKSVNGPYSEAAKYRQISHYICLKTHCNVIFTFIWGYSKYALSFRSSNENVMHLSSLMNATCSTNITPLAFITLIVCGELYIVTSHHIALKYNQSLPRQFHVNTK